MKGGKPCLPGGFSLAQFLQDAGAELVGAEGGGFEPPGP